MNGLNHLSYVLLYVAFIFITPWFLRKNHSKGSIQDSVNALGILGTFVGIAWGLSRLDFGNLQDGIPALINYLFYGFLASIGGFAVSFLVKHSDIYGIQEVAKDASERELLSEIKEELVKVNTNLSGEGETTLVTQIQKMRTSTSDKLEELNKSFNEFAKQMAENNVNALIEAVKKVMEDFNTKINDQLGQSFKELSESVKNLVEWQKEYKVFIESSASALKVTQENLKSSSDSLNNTSEKVSLIVENNKKLAELNNEYKLVLDKLNQMLESSVGFSKGMESLAKELNGSGDTIRKEVKNIVETSVKDMRSHAEEVTRSINTLADASLKQMVDKNTGVLKEFEEVNMKTLQDFGGHLASISGKLADDFRKVQEALSIK